MKVLLVSALPPPAGGIASWTERYLEYCNVHKIDISIVNIALNGDRGKKINDKTNIKDELKRTFRVINDMRKEVKSSGATVVHMNTSCGPLGIFRDYLCVREAYKRKLPIVLHFHCNIENRVHGHGGMWALKKMTLMADEILVLNSTSKEFVAPLSRVEPTIIPNFINSDFLTDKHLIREKIKEVVFVGHVQITKGSKEILEAAAKLPDIHFSLIGPVADEIALLPCPQNVSLVGPKAPNEVKQYLQDADLYLFPSYTEGFSLSLTEAMAMGLPAVATDVGANKDMLEDKGGIIIPVKDSGAIVDAISKVQDEAIRKQMSEWVINKVRDHYLTDTVMGQLIDIYKGMETRR